MEATDFAVKDRTFVAHFDAPVLFMPALLVLGRTSRRTAQR
jgi:hypothetical protein